MDIQSFLVGFFGGSAIEIIASLAGFICVFLIIRRNIWCWPIGLVQVALYMIVFYDAKLYSDFILHGIYVVMQFYGWWYWLQGRGQDDDLVVLPTALPMTLLWVAVAILGSFGLGYVMSTYTDASLPYPDAFTTVASLVAQWLLSRRQLINWGFWIAVDIVAIGVYWQKGLYPTTVLYATFLVMASAGLMVWLRRYQTQMLEMKAEYAKA
ncbi:nicotinamide riboside transporter PnuC [Hahella sp. CR1]|uniref:nicotinamide riboside transporter PnuC n=1 Tax=unclassified Hahella TaxID=2624107 RepID=UPI0024411F56|nr:nicotinamide riboside transporter PnuC [Hahella sp. CR1]MDG9666547.1 nicotinamide riboside transporter PnuC [Hahella sp. CR1]